MSNSSRDLSAICVPLTALAMSATTVGIFYGEPDCGPDGFPLDTSEARAWVMPDPGVSDADPEEAVWSVYQPVPNRLPIKAGLVLLTAVAEAYSLAVTDGVSLRLLPGEA